MAIKIVTPGKFEEKYTGQCASCGCVIECIKQDITYPDRPCSEGYVECPTTGCPRHIYPKPNGK